MVVAIKYALKVKTKQIEKMLVTFWLKILVTLYRIQTTLHATKYKTLLCYTIILRYQKKPPIMIKISYLVKNTQVWLINQLHRLVGRQQLTL
jgi:hypothetical protein